MIISYIHVNACTHTFHAQHTYMHTQHTQHTHTTTTHTHKHTHMHTHCTHNTHTMHTHTHTHTHTQHTQVLLSIPLEALNVLTRLRLLVSCTCWSIVSHQQAASSLSATDNTPHLLTHVPALQSLLVCTLSSLVRQRGKRMGEPQVCPRTSSLQTSWPCGVTAPQRD